MKKIIFLLTMTLALGLSLPVSINANQIVCEDDKKTAESASFEEIQVADLPATVTDALDKDYAEYKIEKAYRGNDGSYKVSVSKDEEKFDVIVNEEGSLTKVA